MTDETQVAEELYAFARALVGERVPSAERQSLSGRRHPGLIPAGL